MAYRCVGEGSKQEVKAFPVFSPKALAGIGDLPDTIADRCIPIRLRRKLTTEKTARGRYKLIKSAAKPVGPAAQRWVDAHGDELEAAEPAIPDALNDRAADGAEPLLAIADLCDGEWPERARGAITELHGEAAEDEGSWGIQLLAAIKAAFGNKKEMPTMELLIALKDDKEAPWISWGKKDGGLDPRELAVMLKPYGIKPKTIRLDKNTTLKGYEVEQFAEAFKRYIPRPPAKSRSSKPPLIGHSAVTPVTTASPSQKQGMEDPSQGAFVTDGKSTANGSGMRVVTGVTAGSVNGGAGAT